MKNLKQQKFQKKKEEEEISRRFFNRNFEAMSFCNKHGLTIYVAAIVNDSSMVRIFVQKGVNFKLLNGLKYNQYEEKDIVSYTVAIDKEYERLYHKMKDIV